MPTPALKIIGTQARGIVSGKAPKGAVIEAINLSQIPTKRLHADDTFHLADAGPDGKFSGKLALDPGDIIRLRARTGTKTTPWVELRASGTDTTNAQVALFRIALKAGADSMIDVSNNNSSRPISEPRARLMFTNKRSGEKTLVVLDDEGTFAKGTQLPGKAGDSFAVAASDGINNKAFRDVVGSVKVPGRAARPTGVVDLPDPKSDKGDEGSDIAFFSGPLIDKAGADPDDAVQGNIGNCFVPSAAGALAATDDQLFHDVVEKRADGTYDVKFRVWDDRRGRYAVKRENVDADLFVRTFGGPLYGADDGVRTPKKMELWYAVFEKGYAQLCGGYNVLGKGGSSADVFSAVLGRDPFEQDFKKPDDLWDALVQKHDKKLPISLGTYGDRAAPRYANTGVYTDHSYSVLDVKKKSDGTRWVRVRNPWGESEPGGRAFDGKDDGKFWMKLEDAARLFRTFYSVV
jgi:hypothetical protein